MIKTSGNTIKLPSLKDLNIAHAHIPFIIGDSVLEIDMSIHLLISTITATSFNATHNFGTLHILSSSA